MGLHLGPALSAPGSNANPGTRSFGSPFAAPNFSAPLGGDRQGTAAHDRPGKTVPDSPSAPRQPHARQRPGWEPPKPWSVSRAPREGSRVPNLTDRPKRTIRCTHPGPGCNLRPVWQHGQGPKAQPPRALRPRSRGGLRTAAGAPSSDGSSEELLLLLTTSGGPSAGGRRSVRTVRQPRPDRPSPGVRPSAEAGNEGTRTHGIGPHDFCPAMAGGSKLRGDAEF